MNGAKSGPQENTPLAEPRMGIRPPGCVPARQRAALIIIPRCTARVPGLRDASELSHRPTTGRLWGIGNIVNLIEEWEAAQ